MFSGVTGSLKRRFLLYLLLLIALMALAGCGPRLGGGQAAAAAGSNDLVVDLPAIYVDFSADGVATIGGMRVSQAGALLGRSLPDLAIPADTLQTLGQYNLQHVQLINSAGGLGIYVNGARMPSLAWDAEVLGNLKNLLADFGISLGPVDGVLPLLGAFNTGVVLRFPLAADKTPLPLVDTNAEAVAAASRAALEAYVAGVGAPLAVQVVVQYVADGTWTVDGKDAAAWEAILPIGWDEFNLEPDTIAKAAAAGIHTFGIASDEEGIQFALNGNRLPTITWGDGEISNVLRLLKSTGVLAQMTDGSAQISGILDMAEGLIPSIQSADVDVLVNFPTQ